MGKMFEALQKIEQEKIEEQREDGSAPPVEQMILDNRLVSYFLQESVAAEQFKKLRTHLFEYATASNEPPRTILVTSSVSGEGKTFVAINLAITMASELQKYALLVDCDLRNPSFAQWFGLEEPRGLSEYLMGEADIPDLLIRTSVDKLTLLCGGSPIRGNPVELIGSKQMEAVISEVTSRYPDRYIIIDAPPLLATTEPSVLTKMVDAIVFVVRAGHTSRDVIMQAMKLVNKDKMAGVVLNDVDFLTSSLNSRYFGSRDGYYGYYAKMRDPEPKMWDKLTPVSNFLKKKNFFKPGSYVK